MRKFVPFGSHWAMGIDVPYSLAVIDGGALWSCGQCPLDMTAAVHSTGDLAAQTRITAGFIRDQFTPCGMPPEGIAKLVAYCVEDGRTTLADVAAILREELGPVPIVLAVGVPHFYYDGMMIEIDVYGGTDGPPAVAEVAQHQVAARSAGLAHAILTIPNGHPPPQVAGMLHELLRAAGADATSIVSARLYADSAAGTTAANALAATIGSDAGRTILATLPAGAAAALDLVLDARGAGEGSSAPVLTDSAGVRMEMRRTAGHVAIAGHIAETGLTLPDATRRIMAALAAALAAEGLGFADVVKQQTHYVGSSSAEDLYVNMRIRNGYYVKPGPASTGLAVHGFHAAGTAIAIELWAVRPSA